MSDNKKIQLCICFPNKNDKRLILNYKPDPNTNSRQIVSLTIGQTFDPDTPNFKAFKELYTILNTIETNNNTFKMDENNSIITDKILSGLRLSKTVGYNNINELNEKIKNLILEINPTNTSASGNGTSNISDTANTAHVNETVTPNVTLPVSISSNPNNKFLLKPGTKLLFNVNYNDVNKPTEFKIYIIENYVLDTGIVKIKGPVTILSDKFENIYSNIIELPYNKFISNIKFQDNVEGNLNQNFTDINQIKIQEISNQTLEDIKQLYNTKNYILFNKLKEHFNTVNYKTEIYVLSYYPIFIDTNNELQYYNEEKNAEHKKDNYDIVVAKILPESESDKINNFLKHLQTSEITGGNINKRKNSKSKSTKKQLNNRRKQTRKFKSTKSK